MAKTPPKKNRFQMDARGIKKIRHEDEDEHSSRLSISKFE